MENFTGAKGSKFSRRKLNFSVSKGDIIAPALNERVECIVVSQDEKSTTLKLVNKDVHIPDFYLGENIEWGIVSTKSS